VLALAAIALDSNGQDKRPAQRQPLYLLSKDVISKGVKIFNENGDHAGCYRLYEGALLSVRPYLDKKLQEEVDGGLAAAAKMPSFSDRAFELRRVLDLVRASSQPLWGPPRREERCSRSSRTFVAAVAKDRP